MARNELQRQSPFLGPFMVQYLSLGVPKRGLDSHPCRVVSNSYQKIVHYHVRGREFESRRPRHSFQRICADLSKPPWGAKGTYFCARLHRLSALQRVPFTLLCFLTL